MPNIQPPPSPQSQVGEIEWGVPKQANLSQFCYVPSSLGPGAGGGQKTLEQYPEICSLFFKASLDTSMNN